MSFDQLLKRLEELPTDGQSSEIVYAIEERERTFEKNRCLADAVRKFIRIVDDTRGINKERMDRRAGRLLKTLPADLSRPIALECISHRRKSRRTAGIESLKFDFVDEMSSRFLVDCFDKTEDVRILKTLLRHPLRLGSIEPTRLLAIFEDDEYWRMRVIEATLKADREVGLEMAAMHPASFIWAAGRIGDPKFTPEISKCFEAAENKVEIIGIVSWAYGKLGAHMELNVMRSVLEEFERQYDFQ